MALAGKKRKIFDGRYEILSIVGRGACSVVYHARHAVQPASEVALKVLLNEKDQKANGEKLRKEALAMVSSRHKYVVRLDDFHSVGELCYLSMEYAPESDLRKYSAKTGSRLHPVQAELFLLQLAEALAFIHRAGIVHRDLKPDNILVVSPKEIRLADFGVAVLPGEKSSLAELQKGVGTMDYMAPEVLEGKTYDLQSDIYALGVTFYELLSGKHPFANAPLVEQLNVRKNGKFPHLRDAAPGIPTYLANVIMQAMSYESSARFPSTKELAQALLVNRTKPVPAAAAPTAPQAQSATPAFAAPSAAAPKPTAPAAPANPAATAPSAAVLAAIKAAAAGKAPPAPTAAAPAAQSPAASPAQRPGVLSGDTPDARRAAAQSLLTKSGAPAASGSTALAQPVVKPPASPVAPAALPAKPAASAPEQPKVSASAPVSPTGARMREVAPTQVMSPAKVAEVTTGGKAGGSLLSRAFEASAAVSDPKQTKSERGAQTETTATADVSSVADTQAVDPSIMAAARTAFSKPDTKTRPQSAVATSGTSAENAKPTQLITRDLVNQVRQGIKTEDKAAVTAKPKQPEMKRAAEAATPKKEKAKQEPPKRQAKADVWKKDPKKSRYMAISMGVLLVILWFGNIFLIKNYHIGIGKSLLGYEEEIYSPIPQFAASAVDFPALPAGLYAGQVNNIAGGRDVPLTLISFGEQKKVAVILGLEGWTPAVVSVDPGAKKADGPSGLRIVSNGLVLNMSGQGSGMELRGTFQDVITGDQSEWHATPLRQQ